MFAQRRWGLDRLGQRAPDGPPSVDFEGAGHASLPARLPPIAPRANDATPPYPDLLNPVRTLTLDAEGLDRVLAFAFVSGDDGGVLERALEHAPIAASDFLPECFFHELFVEDFVRTCMSVRIGGKPVRLQQRYLLRLLSQPPRDLAAVAQRREVWRELAELPSTRAALEKLYLELRAWRQLFEGEDRMNLPGELAQRRIDMLRGIERVFACMAGPTFANSRSALRRIAEFAEHVQASEAHARLLELLRYENERAYADLTLQLGADGTVRGLSVVRVREDRKNRYHVSTARRWLSRLWLLVQGYRVSDAEIIDRWLDHVFDGLRPFLPALLQLIGDLELYLAGLAFRDACTGRGLPVCFPELVEPGQEGQLHELYNPLLFALGITPVPCSLALAQGGVTTLVTGPNSGGKTRLLQAIGLFQLCAQAGMYAPAASAVVPRVPGIFASLSQPVGADQPEGRLGTELLRIRALFERAEPGFLVLVDELCSGTSPSEGEELFRLVLELLVELGPIALVSTHFLKLAAELSHEHGTVALNFVQVELDAEQRPSYRFVPGVAETSLAKQTAARLGVTREELRALLAQKRPLHERSSATALRRASVPPPEARALEEQDAPADRR